MSDIETNEKQNFVLAALSALTQRMGLGSRLGTSYQGKRDLYSTLGFKKELCFEDYEPVYRRQDIAKTVINIKPSVTWGKFPVIKENEKKPTKFETEWTDLVKAKKVFHFLEKGDRLTGIGRYGVLFLGFNDNKSIEQPVEKASELIYLNCYHEGDVEIKQFEKDPKNPRFNQPNLYEIEIEIEEDKKEKKTVHHSRIIHIAEDVCEGEAFGTPRLEAIFNRLQGVEQIVGGSGEMFWRGAYNGIAFKLDKDAKLGPDDEKKMTEEIEDYMHDFQRYLRLQGMEASLLSPTIADPSHHFDIQITCISIETRIPKRILLGSERGELSSNQDERAWLKHIEERRVKQAEHNILRPFIDRLIKVGVLSEPKGGYEIVWEPLVVLTEKEKAEIRQIDTNTFVSYANSIGADTLIPPEIFFKMFMGFTQEQIDQINATIDKAVKEDTQD